MLQKLKIIVFIFLFALLWVPFFQEKTKSLKEPVLKGAFLKPNAPKFSIDSINELKFQKQFEDYENYNFGFRGLFVKIRNSVDNILFNDLSVADYIAGKDGFIFSTGIIEYGLGIKYSSKVRNEEVIKQIRFFKEGIEKNGGHFLTIIAPSKEKILPDFLPVRYCRQYKEPNDYTDFVEGYKKAGIPFIDFTPYFKKLRNTDSYPLFTKTGLHWSMYGASYSQDSLLNYIETTLSKPLPKYKRMGIELSDTARESDADYEHSLNLFYSVGQSKYVYPKLEMIPSTKKNYRPKVIIMGDSFFQQIINLKMLQYIFSPDSKFWFYFAGTAYSLGGNSNIPLLKEADVMDELKTADYVILIANINTLNTFPYGLTEYYAENLSKPGMLDKINESIKINPKWMQAVISKIKDTTVNNAIAQEAKYLFNNRKIVNLKACNDKYLMVDANNKETIFANSDNGWHWETLSILFLKDNKVAIYSHKGKFLSVELGNKAELTATRDKIGDWEKFNLIKLGNNYVTLKTINGKYLSFDEKTKQVFATGNTIGKNERFKVITLKDN